MQLYGRKATKPMKAIRLFCFECMGMDRRVKKPTAPIEDVKGCTDDLCPLFEWRLGLNPYKSQKRVEIGRRLARNRTTELQSTSEISTISGQPMERSA